ncbi:carotenoid biosynthesis protein [Chloroflexota bacterium]
MGSRQSNNHKQRSDFRERAPFLYIISVTILSVILIFANEWFNLGIPFTVHFLIGFVGSLLVFVVWHAFLTKGWRRSLLIFGLSFLIAFGAEALGVNFGLIFGRYYYTDFLGPGLFGVPFLAALAWEPVLYAAYHLADLILSKSTQKPLLAWLGVGAIGAFSTTAWDMMIDPIAVHQGWWVWLDGGAYVREIENGVPVSNFLGWLGIAFLIMLVYRRGIAGAFPRPHSKWLDSYGPIALYASLFLTSCGVTITILENPGVALVGLMAMGPILLIVLFLSYPGVDANL